MKIILKTSVEPEVGEKRDVAISFDTQDLVKIINESGVQQGNIAIDNLVSNYTLDIKKIISEVINK
jgi:hypothetical protein